MWPLQLRQSLIIYLPQLQSYVFDNHVCAPALFFKNPLPLHFMCFLALFGRSTFPSLWALESAARVRYALRVFKKIIQESLCLFAVSSNSKTYRSVWIASQVYKTLLPAPELYFYLLHEFVVFTKRTIKRAMAVCCGVSKSLGWKLMGLWFRKSPLGKLCGGVWRERSKEGFENPLTITDMFPRP
jgi:hypothetical protein